MQSNRSPLDSTAGAFSALAILFFGVSLVGCLETTALPAIEQCPAGEVCNPDPGGEPPRLLATYSDTLLAGAGCSGSGSEGGHPWESVTEVQVLLRCGDAVIGGDIWLGDGDNGEYDYTPPNSPGFDDFTECLTDGVPDNVSEILKYNACGIRAETFGTPEDRFWSLSPGVSTLTGREIVLVRLSVADLRLTSRSLTGTHDWEIWGY